MAKTEATIKRIASVLAQLVVGCVAGWAIMCLWNDTVPFLFSVPQIGYWQAVELYFLMSMFGLGLKN